MKVVSSTSDEERAEKLARQDLEWPLREAAANMLRVIRGSGRPAEVARLMQRAIEAFIAYRDAAGHFPPSETIAEILTVQKTESVESWRRSFQSDVNDADFERWLDDGNFAYQIAIDKILRAALQISALRLLDQKTQETTTQHDLFEGIRDLERAKETRERSTRRAEMTMKPGRRAYYVLTSGKLSFCD